MEQILSFDIGEQLSMAMDLLESTWEKARILDSAMYYSFVAMLVENRCKIDGEDVVQKFAELSKTAQEIKDMIGEY
ncbi:MAG: hypothetical protein IKO45_04980 [Clostridia bacterium]|nr:hypothetical protein [Clostridia bacterium]MBR4623888.1 hypothetical protein [Clostridia bacterium]